jgi:hypothetical protein
MVLSLFFSVTSALVSTLIQQWGREYLQYSQSQPSAAPYKRGRVRAYLHDGLSQFQMRRMTYGVPVLLHVSVFLFFYALSEWLYSINVPVGATARYCLVALLAVYMALSVLPLIVRNSPYQTALTTPLQACVTLIQISFLGLRQLVWRTSRIFEGQKRSGLFKSLHVDRARVLLKEIKTRASELDRSAMRWLLQELDEDDMDTFLDGLPGYIHSPLTDKKSAIEGLMEDGVPGRIREHITTCLGSVELSSGESTSRASACINSLRLIFETASITAVRRPGSENDDIQAIMDYLEPLCFNFSPSTGLRASCIRSLVIREFLIPFGNLDAEEIQTKKFPDHLIPLYRAVHVWKTTEISQWSGIVTATSHPLPSDQEMWANVVYDGPLINLAVFAYAVLLHTREGNIGFDMAWETTETLLKSLSTAQVRASALARSQFDKVVKARAGNSGHEGGNAQVTPLQTLDIVMSGLRLAEAFAYTPKPKLPPKQIQTIFGPEQLRNSELLEAFATHLPRFVSASAPEVSKTFMERLILEDKLWEQIHDCLLRCFDPKVPFPNKLRTMITFFDIFEVAFEVLKDSSIIDWLSPGLGLSLLSGQVGEFRGKVTPGRITGRAVPFRSEVFNYQFCHAMLVQFSTKRSRGEPFMNDFLYGLTTIAWHLGLGREEIANLQGHGPNNVNWFDRMIKADAILSSALRDGPLTNFCMLGRFAFDMVAPDVPDLTSNDTKKLWKLLGRMLDTPQLPLANASVETWVRFDHLRALVRDPAFSGGNDQMVERLQPLLDMIEKVERMRPHPDSRAEGTGNADNPTRVDGPADRGTGQPGGPPIPGSSRQAGGP